MLVDCFDPVAADRNITIDLQCDAQLRHTAIGAHIDVAIGPVPQGIAILVCNPGLGIPNTALPPLLERFYRGGPSQAQSSAQSSQSTGLGLAIVKTIMDLHGGSVHASSPPGGRTEFRLVFPA
ncbi:MAG: ATP-binding protein [Ralstonia sp.]|jgi:two-component system, OmpR family, heavy metal sensor histidine kinase CusS|uniref:histidine kinase n=2 Tax=Pseudomonadota TaxID=1224 RepID=A0A2P4RBY8_RALPI|nr:MULTISPECIES: ATP-binding protein [Ralstonia]RYO79415.1 hypothetical protein DL763_009292 [Monosporascus cannonballus]RYP59282.1 hypothetical protein DL771_010938 [Monosporascus sp. 5C6A]MBA4200364.1 hypothetical protein [Ralstonia sp.]MBA4229454.1 hypothetical protein [Ralstonia sp.]MBA4238960.1 hypothetical protein [Ralstonia sp.]